MSRVNFKEEVSDITIQKNNKIPLFIVIGRKRELSLLHLLYIQI